MTARSLQTALERWHAYLEKTEHNWREGVEKEVKRGSKSSGLGYSEVPVKQLCVLTYTPQRGTNL